jgi:hypothetical protein
MGSFNEFFLSLAPYLFILLILSVGFLVYLVLKLQKDIETIKANQTLFFSGTKAKAFETVITDKFKEINRNKENIQKLFDFSNHIHALSLQGISHVGIVRFNPFENTGSNQSFSIALLDSHKNGVVISSLYTRDGVRIYAKPIQKEKSEFQLTEEENIAIQKSLQKS